MPPPVATEDGKYITSRAVCDRGEWLGLGLEDGSVRFSVPGQTPDGLGTSAASNPLGSTHAEAHDGPVTCVTLLRASIAEPVALQVSLGCSASDDQTIIVWDLRAGAPLHKLLTASRSPVTALKLELLLPRAAATGWLAEPSVLLLAGSADGGVQVWALTGSAPPALRACWRHSTRSPIVKLAHVSEGDDARVVSVASVVNATEDGVGEVVEMHSTSDWSPLLSPQEEEAAAMEGATSAAAQVDVSDPPEYAEPQGYAAEEETAAAAVVASRDRTEPFMSTRSSQWDKNAPPTPAKQKGSSEAQPDPEPLHRANTPGKGGAEEDEDAKPRAKVPVAHGTAAKGSSKSGGKKPARAMTDDERADAAIKAAEEKMARESKKAAARIYGEEDNPYQRMKVDLPRLHPKEQAPAKFDSPYRVLSMVAAAKAQEEEEEEARRRQRVAQQKLSKPAVNSTARLALEAEALKSRTFEEVVPPEVVGEAVRMANKEATPLLNTDADRTDRYGNLTSLKGEKPELRQESERRKEEGEKVRRRKLEVPSLLSMYTYERDPQFIDTNRYEHEAGPYIHKAWPGPDFKHPTEPDTVETLEGGAERTTPYMYDPRIDDYMENLVKGVDNLGNWGSVFGNGRAPGSMNPWGREP